MWWFWFIDPEDYGKVAVVSIILAALLILGYWIWGPDDTCKKDNKKSTYDTVQNDSVIILKKKGHYVYDTVEKTDSTIVLKRRIVYN